MSILSGKILSAFVTMSHFKQSICWLILTIIQSFGALVTQGSQDVTCSSHDGASLCIFLYIISDKPHFYLLSIIN